MIARCLAIIFFLLAMTATRVEAQAVSGPSTVTSNAIPRWLDKKNIGNSAATLDVNGNLTALINGSNITSGLIPIGRMPTNVAQLTGTNVWGGTNRFTLTLLGIGGVDYTWPGLQGAAGTLLQNDGAGGLTWATGAGGLPGGSTPQAQYKNGANFAGIPSLLYIAPTLTISNMANPMFYMLGTNEGSGNLATYSWDVGPSGFTMLREYNPSKSISNLVFSFGGGISGGVDLRAQAYGNFYVSSNVVATTVTTTNLVVNGSTTTGGSIAAGGAITASGSVTATNKVSGQDLNATNSITAGGSVTGNGFVSTQTTPGGLLMSYATVDAFNFGIVRPSSAISMNQHWILPTTNAAGLSFVTIAFTGTNGQLGYTLISTVGGGAVNATTNQTFYGPQRYLTTTDSTNASWATNAYTKQGITTNTVVTLSFINAPPLIDSELTFTVNNTAATNIPVLFLDANAITNNVLLNGNTSALTSYDIPPGISQFDWDYNGNKYYLRVTGPPVTFSSYAAGTAWTETTTSTNTAFGTTSPKITFTAGGTYRLRSAVGVKYSGATFTGTPTINVKLRKTNGTAADVSNATITLELPVLTSFTGGDSIVIPDTDFTVARGDVVEIYSNVSALPSPGSVQVDSGWIVADRKY